MTDALWLSGATLLGGLLLGAVGRTLAIRNAVTTKEDHDRSEAARDERCKRCEAALEACITKEKFRDIVKPIREELRHRRRQFNQLGRRMVSMDRKLTALLVANNVDIQKFESQERSSVDDEGDDPADDTDLE